MPIPNVGNITARANVCTCNCGSEGFCNNCDCMQTNEIGRKTAMRGITVDMETNNNFSER